MTPTSVNYRLLLVEDDAPGGFGVIAAVADRWRWSGLPRWLVVSPVRYLWLIPLTMIPQSFMGVMQPSFGPDTSTGLMPAPHILFYYAIFFAYGVLYFDCNDEHGRVGRWWPVALPLAALLVFPIGLEFSLGVFGFRSQLADPTLFRHIAVTLQVLYAWIMTFGLMRLFRRLLSRESKVMRYLSDSSYWLYVAHMPLIFIAQVAVRTWPLPATVKFFLVSASITGFLLLTYHWFVRYTWLGTFLNGRRERPVPESEVIVAELVSG